MRTGLDITLIATAIATAIAMCGLPASAAQYKWIDTGGRVNYSDRQPPHDAQILESPGTAPADAEAVLPYAIRQASAKYPVLLYTSSDCEPCGSAREHLLKRGIPFTEYTLRTKADTDAYVRNGFDGKTVPGIKVGRQTASGYDATALNALLDAAGYPKSARLPAQYMRPAPRALAGDAGAGVGTGKASIAGPAALGQAAGLRDGPAPDADARDGDASGSGMTAVSAPRTNPPEPVPAAGPNPALRF
ncbi:MAG: glutaredoxin family protein [Burkholderiaceae bacterium]